MADGVSGVMKLEKTHKAAKAEERASLAIWARRLNQRAGVRGLPALFLVTDERWLTEPESAIGALPRGAGVIFRHYGDPARARHARDWARLCRARGHVFLVARDGGLALRLRADGVHLPEREMWRVRGLRRACPRWLITVAVHGEAALRAAEASGADAVLLAPVFPTRSHPVRKSLGVVRFTALARRARLPVYALGGIDTRGAQRLAASGAAGLAALSALAP